MPQDMLTAVFRCDASPAMGGGHVSRCLVLADELMARGWSCTFLSVKGSAGVVPALASGRHRLVDIETSAAASPHVLQDIERTNLLIVDHYDLDAAFETAGRTHADRVMVIDDIPGRPHDCDILLDQTLGRQADEYRPLLHAPDALLLLGSGFALLQPGFAALRPKALSRRTGGLDRVLVSFGATDPWGLCHPAAEAACAARIPHVDIAVGSACPHLDSLRELTTRHRQIHLHVNADMPPLMAVADLALGASGSTAWERCCLGLPTILTVAADNQMYIAHTLAMAGAAAVVELGAGRAEEAFAAALAKLAEHPEGRVAMAQAAALQCDGRGAGRVAAFLTVSTQQSNASDIYLRAATPDDTEILYKMQSHPETRRYSRNTAVPSFDEHGRWMQARLASVGSFLQVICKGQSAVGSIRLDPVDGEHDRPHYEISIVIDPAYKNQGIGAASLKLIEQQFQDAVILAWIRDDNRASQAVFAKAGFSYDRDGWHVWRG